VVLDFWATWCPPCREELPTVDKLRAEFGDKVQFFGISDEDAGTVKGFLRKNNNGLPTLMDQKETVHRQYGVSAIPTLLVIDRDGVIRSHFIGGRSPETLRDAIAKVLGQ
jgi:thiol-disulfide isomerase/thioredoxin